MVKKETKKPAEIVYCRIPRPLLDQVDAAALKQGRTRSNMIAVIVAQYVEGRL